MQARKLAIQLIQEREFDVAVIGGGIVGVGVAQNAASRGLSVAIVEKADFASGTSSKTTKLIHGGLRYLEQLDFRLTRELCQERGLLEQLAPQLVRDHSFILPISDTSKFFGFKARCGLTLYDLLGWNAQGLRRHQRLTQKEVLGYAPSLSPDKVTAGLRFHDCLTDDARLVIEVLKSACERGAVAANYMEAKAFELESGRVARITLRDRYSGQDVVLKCKSCVNATGVWSDDLMSQIDPAWVKQVTPAKGVHLMLPASAFETNTALFLPTLMKDGRYVFVVPWQKAIMVGTTDTVYSGSLDAPLPQEDEIDYLLNVLNNYSRTTTVNRSDVTAAWAGLRPLVRGEETAKASNGSTAQLSGLSREHELIEGPGGIIGLIGGKLTNFRILANHVTEKLKGILPSEVSQAMRDSNTDHIMLGGWNDKEDYLKSSAEISARARKAGIEPASLDHILRSYGKDALKIVEIVERDSLLNKRICPEFPPIMAEVAFSVKHEMAVSLEDVLFRRIRLALVHQEQCMVAAEQVARLVQALVGWDDNRRNLEVDSLCATLKEHLECKKKSSV
ncbi:MAG: glycerol-3-phosphate dehydrogenase/oxidase [Cyanobacteria bacterium]|nr:glycerol-3-phosphate dehydrogenase/oxidase [Cyanobacteriota bacterium]